MVKTRNAPRGKNHVWIVPVILLVVLVASVGGYYAWSRLDKDRPIHTESAPTTSQPANSPTPAETTVDPEWQKMVAAVEQDVFYQGIWLDEQDLAGKSYTDVRSQLYEKQGSLAEATAVELTLGDKTFVLTGADIGLSSDWLEVLEQAWQTGRTSDAKDENEQIRARYAVITALKEKPLKLATTLSWDEAKLQAMLATVAEQVNVAAQGAKAVDFDTKNKTFVFADRTPGFAMDLAACRALVAEQLQNGRLGAMVAVAGEQTWAGLTAAEMGKNLGLISDARTVASNNDNRNENIRLICQKINGLVLNPGETFSFNGHVGERTKETGSNPLAALSTASLKTISTAAAFASPTRHSTMP